MGMTVNNKPYQSQAQETCLLTFVLHQAKKGDLHCQPWCGYWACCSREGDTVDLLGATAPQSCASLPALLSAPHAWLREYISFLLRPCHPTLLLSLSTTSIPSWIKVWLCQLCLADGARRMVNLHAARNTGSTSFKWACVLCWMLHPLARVAASNNISRLLLMASRVFVTHHTDPCTASNIARLSRSPKGMQEIQRMKSKLSLPPVILISWAW